MSKYFTLVILVLVGLYSVDSFGQQDAQFSHFMFSKLYYNPGYSGVEGVSRATLLHRSQWLGYQGVDEGGAPTSQMLTFNHPLKMFSSPTVNSGAGFVLTHDMLGPWRILNLKVSGAYHIKLQNGGVISTGLRAGFLSQSIDGSVLRASEDNDVIVDGLSGSVNSQLRPDLGIGIYYNTKKYWGGATLSHVNNAEYEFGLASDSIASKLARHLFVSGGYNFYLGQNLVVSPTALIQTDFSETSFNYGAVASLNNYKYWGGLTLRQSFANKPIGESGKKLANDDIVLLIGMSFLENNTLRLGYAFDIVTSGVSAKNPTSHEIMLSYVLPIDPESKYVPIRTPRYRKEN